MIAYVSPWIIHFTIQLRDNKVVQLQQQFSVIQLKSTPYPFLMSICWLFSFFQKLNDWIINFFNVNLHNMNGLFHLFCLSLLKNRIVDFGFVYP